MNATTLALQARLWQMYGDPRHPAEWDGRIYGGGKISQRFWEYHRVIHELELSPDSVLLDIGGGSPKTGVSLFVKVVALAIKGVIVVDPTVPETIPGHPNVTCIPVPASYNQLTAVLDAHPEITHVGSVSVLEHIDPPQRIEILRAINDGFRGDTFVLSLEFHETARFFDEQLTTSTLSDLVSVMTRFVPVSIEASPIYAENALRPWVPVYERFLRRFGLRLGRSVEETPPVRLWKPLVIKFVRMPADVEGARA